MTCEDLVFSIRALIRGLRGLESRGIAAGQWDSVDGMPANIIRSVSKTAAMGHPPRMIPLSAERYMWALWSPQNRLGGHGHETAVVNQMQPPRGLPALVSAKPTWERRLWRAIQGILSNCMCLRHALISLASMPSLVLHLLAQSK